MTRKYKPTALTLWPRFEQWLREGGHDAIFRTLEAEYDNRFRDSDE